MAWDEWERIKSAQGAPGTRLDSAGPAAGGGTEDLVVRRDDLGAVGHEAYLLHESLAKASDIAGRGLDKNDVGSTLQASAELKKHDMALGEELSSGLEIWRSQAKAVLQAVAHISNHLDYSAKRHDHDDARIAADLRGRKGPVPVSALLKAFH